MTPAERHLLLLLAQWCLGTPRSTTVDQRTVDQLPQALAAVDREQDEAGRKSLKETLPSLKETLAKLRAQIDALPRYEISFVSGAFVKLSDILALLQEPTP